MIKKKTILFTMILSMFFLNLNSQNIHSAPGQVFPGTRVDFSIQGGNVNAAFTYDWNFGDGTPPVSGPQAAVNHTYSEPGTYDVTCSRTSPGGGDAPHLMNARVVVTERRTVEPKGSVFTAGSPVSFETNHFVENNLNWDFGDGTVNNGPKNRDHAYPTPGNYTVKVKDYGGSSSSVITCTVNIVPDNRSMEYQPGSPRAGQKVSFQAKNFSSGNLRWDFGDSTVQNAGASAEHTYLSQGNYKVRITDLAIGQDSFIEENVGIAADNRSVTMNPQNPSLYDEVTFNAVNFSSGSIEWDFDRGVKKTGGQSEKFTFTNMGSYNVKAKEAGSDSSFVILTVSINQDKRKIIVQPPAALVGQQVVIKLQNTSANTVTWKIANDNPMPNSPVEIQYRFQDPGRMEVLAEIQGQSPVREWITINDNRSIQTEDKYIFEKSECRLSAKNFNSPQLKWDMGDGTIMNGGAQVIHKFQMPGNFTVKVFDFDGNSKVPVQLRVTVLRENREIAVRNKMIFENSEVEFEARNFIDQRVKWIFGDGTEKPGPRKITHQYSRPGTYRLLAVDFDGKGDKKFDLSINVLKDNRSLKVPDTVIAGVPVKMELAAAQGGNFEWQVPDGKKTGIGVSGEFLFNTPGTKKIVITDRTGTYPPLTKTINVIPDNRSLDLNSGSLLPEEELKLNAVNFKGTAVLWNFGDGSTPQVMPKSVAYKYAAPGTYKITAVDDEGKGKKVFEKTVTVKEQMDDFTVTDVELAFSNGKYYRVVPMNSFSPGYTLKLKTSGKGILNGKWMFNDKVIGLFSELIAGRSILTLKGTQVPKLPVLETGVHALTLEFTNYEFTGDIPVLRYFVTNSGEIQIISPEPGAKLTDKGSVRLKWQKKKKGDRFEIAVSQIPFQFLKEKNIPWTETGMNNFYDLDTAGFNPGQYVYWQVRMVDATGTMVTASDISYFRINGN